jgi:hypothetical protein
VIAVRSGDEHDLPPGAPDAAGDHARRRQEQEMLSRFGVSSIDPAAPPDGGSDTSEAAGSAEASEPAAPRDGEQDEER